MRYPLETSQYRCFSPHPTVFDFYSLTNNSHVNKMVIIYDCGASICNEAKPFSSSIFSISRVSSPRTEIMIYSSFCLLLICAVSATFVDFDFSRGSRLWSDKRIKFLSKLKYIKHCFTDTKTNEIMRVINSNQCSAVGLPLEDAIRLEYDNWLSEDWFPNDEELAAMKLDEVM